MKKDVIYAAKNVKSVQKINLLKNDANTHMIKFIVPIEYGGVDLSNLSWCINLINANDVQDVALPAETPNVTDDSVCISWLIGGTATAAVGDTQFELVGFTGSGEDTVQVWQSAIYSLTVTDNIDIDTPEDIQQQLSDVQEFIVYVEDQLDTVLDARDAANAAAERAETISDQLEDSELERESNEEERQDNETQRIANEAIRVQNELLRVASETERESEEETRITNENTRIYNETTRATGESSRISNETVRETNELARIAAETNRYNKEVNRVNAETNRNTNESLRQANEAERIRYETGRNNAEIQRYNAEQSRVTAERGREIRMGNFNISATRVSDGITVTITDGDGVSHTVKVMDGEKGSVYEGELVISDITGLQTELDKKADSDNLKIPYVEELPTASISYLGKIVILHETGEDDVLVICLYKDGAYGWYKFRNSGVLGDLILSADRLGE